MEKKNSKPTKRNVKFDSKLLKEKIESNGIGPSKLSSLVLNRDPSYISQACLKESINVDDLKKLCKFFDLDYNSLVIEDEPKLAPQKASSKKETDYGEKLDIMLVGVNTLYETNTTTNELLREFIKELRAISVKMDRIEKRVGSVENATGQLVAKSVSINENLEGVEKNIKDAKSSLAIINGRVTDIYNEGYKNYKKTG